MTAGSNNEFRIAGALGVAEPADPNQEHLTQGLGFPLRPISGVPSTDTPTLPDGVVAEGIPTQWMGDWSEGKYYPAGAEVIDAEFNCVCVVPFTLQKPAPINDGPPSFSLPSYTPAEQSYTGFVRSGSVITLTQSGWVKKLRVWLPAIGESISYQCKVVRTTPDGDVATATISSFLGVEGNWAAVAALNAIAPSGTKYEIFLDALNSGGSVEFTGGWRFQGIDNSNAPQSQSWNKNQQNTIVRVNDIDLDSTDRSTELNGVIPNSTITITDTANPNNFETYRVNSIVEDIGVAVEYGVTLIDSEGSIEALDVCRLDFDVPIAQPTDYAEQTSVWPGGNPSWGTVTGYLELDGVEQSVDNNAYGVDIEFQPATVTTDWDIKGIIQL